MKAGTIPASGTPDKNLPWLRAILPVCAAALLVVLLSVGAVLRFSVANDALSDPDTWGYLNPALSFLSGNGLRQTAGRDWLYPMLLVFALKSTGSFAGLIVIQKILGCLTGVLMAVAWLIWTSFLGVRRQVQYGLLLLGAIPIFAQMTNPQAVVFEMQIRPEAVMGFFVFAQICCGLAYCRYRWQFPRSSLAFVFGILAIALAYANCLLKPSWIFAFAATILPVFIGIFGTALPLRTRALTPVFGIAATLIFLWLPGKILTLKDSAARTFLPSTLLTIHAQWIKDSLERKLAAMSPDDPEKQRLHDLLEVFNREFETARTVSHNYDKLGYDPDYLYYKSSLLDTVKAYAGGTDEGFRAFCMKAYQTAALENPAGMSGKVLTQMTHFLIPEPSTFYRHRLDLQKLRLGALDYQQKIPELYGPEVAAMYRVNGEALAAAAPHKAQLQQKAYTRDLAKRVAEFSPAVQIAFLIAFVLCLTCRRAKCEQLAGWTALFLYAAPAGNAATISLVHALDISRYRYSYGVFFLFALTAMAAFIVVVFVKLTFPAAERFLTAAAGPSQSESWKK